MVSSCPPIRSLVGYSQFPDPAEVLLSPNAKFVVQSDCSFGQGGYYYVALQEVRAAGDEAATFF